MSHVGIAREIVKIVTEYKDLHDNSLSEIKRLVSLEALRGKLFKNDEDSLLIESEVYSEGNTYRVVVKEIEWCIIQIEDILNKMKSLGNIAEICYKRALQSSKKYYLKNKTTTQLERQKKNRNDLLPVLSLEEVVILSNTAFNEISSDTSTKIIIFYTLREYLGKGVHSDFATAGEDAIDIWGRSTVDYNEFINRTNTMLYRSNRS